jgi:hypothetical protein
VAAATEGNVMLQRLTGLAGLALLLTGSSIAQAQDSKDRQVEQYECKDIMRDSGANRDVSIAFLHGFLLGKSASSSFNLDKIKQQTEAFVERCLSNPAEKALDAMTAVRK